LSDVGDVERLEVQLDGAGRDHSSRPGSWGGGGGRALAHGGPHGLSGQRGGCCHHGQCGRSGWSSRVLEVELDSTLDILLEGRLEGPAVLVEGDGAGEGVRVSGSGRVLLELDGGAVEGEAVQLSIEVERSGLCWPGSDPHWSPGWNWSSGWNWGSGWHWGSSWDWGSGWRRSPLWVSVGSKVGEL